MKIDNITNIQRILLNVFSNYANLVISIIIAFIMSPFLINQLGDYYYGVWAIIMSFVGYFSLMDFGMNRAIVKYVSEYDAKGQYDDLMKFINTCFLIYTLAGLIVIVLTIILSLNFDKIVNITENVLFIKVVIFIVGIDFAFAFPFGSLYAILIAKQKHTYANKINIVTAILRSIIIYVILHKYHNLLILSVIYVFSNMMKNIWIYYGVKQLYPELKFKFISFSKDDIKKILDYSIYSFAISISSRVINFTDEIVIGRFLKVADVTVYSIAVNLITYYEKIIWSGASVFVPYISQLDAEKNTDSVENSFFIGSKYSFLISLYFYFGFILFGEGFINTWIGKGYGSKVYTVLVILATSKLIVASQSMSVARLFGTNTHKFLGKMNICEALLNLVLSIIFVKKFGMIGVAIGTLIPCIIFNGLLLPIYSIYMFKISYIHIIEKIIIKPLFISLLSYYVIQLVHISYNSYTKIFIYGFLYTLLFSFISLCTLTDKKKLIERLRK